LCTQDWIYLEVPVLIIICWITSCFVVLGIVFGPESKAIVIFTVYGSSVGKSFHAAVVTNTTMKLYLEK
jgi:hypothetical protein